MYSLFIKKILKGIYLNPRFFKFRTSLYKVIISGKKLTLSFKIVPVLLDRARTDSMAKILPDTPRLRCCTYTKNIIISSTLRRVQNVRDWKKLRNIPFVPNHQKLLGCLISNENCHHLLSIFVPQCDFPSPCL